MRGNIKLNGKWLSGDGSNEGVYVNSAGRVGIGTSTPGYVLDVMANIFRVANSGPANTVLLFQRYSASSSYYPQFVVQKSHTDSFGTMETTTDGEVLGAFIFQGDNAGKTGGGAGRFVVRQDGNATATAVPGRLDFVTTSPTASDVTRMVIRNDGKVGIGTTVPVETLHVNGSGRFEQGIAYIPALGDLSMGTFTNTP
jgi:hypothetical protein